LQSELLSAVGVLGVWRGVEDSPGVSDVGWARLEPATNGFGIGITEQTMIMAE
jgi:hypothetical protein